MPDVTKAVGAVEERIHKLMNAPEPMHAPEHFHRKLGRIIWTKCGMSRSKEGLEEALREIPKLRDQFWREVKIVGSGAELNQTLERAGRVADFFELGELMCIDALQREESCGGHFREEYEENGEALRDDEHFSVRLGLGVDRKPRRAAAPQRTTDLRIRQAQQAKLQVRGLSMSEELLNLTLHVWRQDGPTDAGRFETHQANGISTHMSFLEMLDVVNEDLIERDKSPIAFDHDCREGICGSCGMVINGVAHGPQKLTTACQLHMRQFKNGDEVWLEPWRASGFPVVKDLVVDRSALDRIIQAGGYISIRTGSASEANEMPIAKAIADQAMDAAECIGCGACVAACPNASASLFTAAKISHLSLLPQGQAERQDRARKMVAQMDAEGFGGCTNHGECEAACPKGVSLRWIARMNRELVRSMVRSDSGSKSGRR